MPGARLWSSVRLRPGTADSPRIPATLLRTTLRGNAIIMMAVAGLCMPLAILAVLHGGVLPLLLAGLAVAAGGASLLALQQGNPQLSVAEQVYALLAAGLLLTIADAAVADFGLVVAALAPITAALAGGRRLRNRSWVAFALVILIDLALAWHQVLPEPHGQVRLAGALTVIMAVLVVAHTTNRLNTAFEVYDRGQINAYRHLIEHVQDAVLRFSREGELLFSSRSAENLLGCRRYELSGPGLVERIHVLDRPAYLTAFADANQGGIARTIELRMRYDGTPGRAPLFLWVEMALSPVLDQNGAEMRHEVVVLARDVTDRRDQENEMRAARRAAEEASEAKTHFLATIGHELRTPLNAIIGFSEMMSSGIGGELSPTHREYAELIHNSGTHLIGVVSMLLDMSRIEAGKFELNTDSFAPATLVEPGLNMVAPLARAKGISFDTRIHPGLPEMVADERACRQVLINLLSNAIKFSHEHGRIEVTIKQQGAWISLSVRDHGVGMAAETVARIGEPFFQANEGLSRRYEGTGLGLSIVKGLVDLHQGQMRITSEPGAGTTVTILLPINGPETKMSETGAVTPLRREEPAPVTTAPWPEKRRSAK